MMLKPLFILAIFALLNLTIKAEVLPTDSILVDKPLTTNNLDSLVSLWFNKQLSPGDDTSFVVEEFTDSLVIPAFTDSVYRARLAAMPMIIELSYNNIVRNYIHMYTNKRRDLVENMLGLSDYYFPIFEEILDAKGMPLELKYLPVIESALNPNAVSRVGATGMWQFMYYTGKMYKLEINSMVDERRDPIKASYAAVEFMLDLYDIYHDWVLVIAAYNCGPGNVNKAIRRSGGKRDYWDIYYRLPRETRGYVPAFIAAAYVMNYYKEHNLTPKQSALPIRCDTLMINEKIHLEQISQVMNIPIDELRSLNPQYRRDIIPGNTKPYALRLPFNETTRFIDLQDSIVAFNDSIYFNPEALSKSPQYSTGAPGAVPANHEKLVYTVKSGDNLGFIAQWYGVGVSDLRYWNYLHGNTIHSGQKLAVYIPKSKAATYRDINTMSFAQKQASIGKTVKETKPVLVEELKPGEYELYTVKRGDTLWDIARLYPGITDTDIMRWNGIDNARNISVGQKLKIKTKS